MAEKIEDVAIIVNGRTHKLAVVKGIARASYDAIVQLAGYGNGRPGPLTITYRRRGGTGGGVITMGQTLVVTGGEIFNVADTSNA